MFVLGYTKTFIKYANEYTKISIKNTYTSTEKSVEYVENHESK